MVGRLLVSIKTASQEALVVVVTFNSCKEGPTTVKESNYSREELLGMQGSMFLVVTLLLDRARSPQKL
jgi:hypothetical protein